LGWSYGGARKIFLGTLRAWRKPAGPDEKTGENTGGFDRRRYLTANIYYFYKCGERSLYLFPFTGERPFVFTRSVSWGLSSDRLAAFHRS
jgi:hypothetical protein